MKIKYVFLVYKTVDVFDYKYCIFTRTVMKNKQLINIREINEKIFPKKDMPLLEDTDRKPWSLDTTVPVSTGERKFVPKLTTALKLNRV